ncbi:MAG: prolyl oligopeptidase family serine peptidase [Pirellulaceae bacterium]|nr:prolyl oligopeptidase family serine peptidase [Pirellulaceae bacterium]
MLLLPSPCPAATTALNPTFFSVGGHQAFILYPATYSPDDGSTPWVWYAPTLVGSYPNASTDWLFQQLLNNGIAVAGMDVGESYGNPAGRAAYSDFYDYATNTAKLSPKALLLAQSRGGLMLYNWAAENTDKVSGIAGIYPVGDLRSYPGLETAAPAYDMTAQQLFACLSEHNPIDRLAPLAQAGIPIFHIHGDSDATVPLDENSQVIYDRYTALGGDMQLVVVPGKGHEEITEFFQSQPLLSFMLENACSVPEPSAFMLAAMGGAFGLLGLLARLLRKHM